LGYGGVVYLSMDELSYSSVGFSVLGACFWYEWFRFKGVFGFLQVNGVLFSLRRLTPPSPLFL